MRQLYTERRDTLLGLAADESVAGDNRKLLQLRNLLSDLYSNDADPRGTAQV